MRIKGLQQTPTSVAPQAMVPVQTVRASRRGWGQRNLYRLDPQRLLAMDLADVRRYIEASGNPPV